MGTSPCVEIVPVSVSDFPWRNVTLPRKMFWESRHDFPRGIFAQVGNGATETIADSLTREEDYEATRTNADLRRSQWFWLRQAEKVNGGASMRVVLFGVCEAPNDSTISRNPARAELCKFEVSLMRGLSAATIVRRSSTRASAPRIVRIRCPRDPRKRQMRRHLGRCLFVTSAPCHRQLRSF